MAYSAEGGYTPPQKTMEQVGIGSASRFNAEADRVIPEIRSKIPTQPPDFNEQLRTKDILAAAELSRRIKAMKRAI